MSPNLIIINLICISIVVMLLWNLHSFGRFVNRYPVETDTEEGYRCDKCEQEILKECYVICTSCETDYAEGNTVCPHCGHHERRPYES